MTHRESTLTAAYRAACHIVTSRLVGRLDTMQWRHHGLGMLQAELTETMRVHIWHPKLRTIPENDFRDVHDHRFTIVSFVAAGELTDVPFRVRFRDEMPGFQDMEDGWKPNAEAYEIIHAKEQERAYLDAKQRGCSTATLTKPLGQVLAVRLEHRAYRAGDVYTIQRRAFHTTRVEDFCITIVSRVNFDDKLARVLGSPELIAHVGSAIVPETDASRAMRAWVLKEADARLGQSVLKSS